ncbi:kelch-like protein 10 [Centruroides vittatus]|uniref:kelch-like protein 10 n=1 Tax=Centruroides vittatus TaxID=120091 RepID=UPI003510118E
MEILYVMRNYGSVCDGILKTEEGREFPIHRIIMVTCSPYFEALYNSPINIRRRTEIIIPNISADMLGKIIDFAYMPSSFHEAVNFQNVFQLIKVANKFLINKLVDICCAFLIDNINDQNCIVIWKCAKQYNYRHMEAKALKYLMINFIDIQKERRYLEISLDEIITILKKEELNVKHEESVWEGVLIWIDHDPDNRSKYINQLMRCVRFGLINPEYFIAKVKNNKYVKFEDKSCRRIIIEAIRCLFDLKIGHDSKSKLQLQKPRLPREVLFVIGGWNGDIPINLMESYDIKTDSWMLLSIDDPTGPRAYHRCAVMDNHIYIIGGYDGVEFFNTCWCFDILTLEWQEIAPMYSHRCYVSVATVGRHIYALGGFNGRVRLRSAEKYNCDTNQWTMIAPMNNERSDASATELSGSVYIVGGFNGNEFLSCAEFYNPDTNQWTNISSMKTRRCGVCCINYNGYLYVFGGFNGISRLCSGEVYNPYTQKWYTLEDMSTARSNFAVVVLEDLIFVMGGFNGITTVSSVECYDVKKEQWIQVKEMNLNRSALDACVLKDIPNIEDYIPPRNESFIGKKSKLHFSDFSQEYF